MRFWANFILQYRAAMEHFRIVVRWFILRKNRRSQDQSDRGKSSLHPAILHEFCIT
ncbi:hypothetical protein CP97_14768 [Aurantiacibacter atlanticus]|uniref:Uncharacterized protein n=1 Tax=Aurantiacibacter atlanticus TaxID=1648404 RepID=A0A161IGE0_9SPHN|nr:hypothetical protein CP97_14768 [Aurantiacibacter atlanticus]